MLILVCSVVSGVSSVNGSVYVNVPPAPIVLGVVFKNTLCIVSTCGAFAIKKKPHPHGWGFLFFGQEILWVCG